MNEPVIEMLFSEYFFFRRYLWAGAAVAEVPRTSVTLSAVEVVPSCRASFLGGQEGNRELLSLHWVGKNLQMKK